MNRLGHETSPYLRQHASNPVDWYPWGPEALARAKELSRPIFLSIGYSACHWCHVMEHESFEDASTAKVLNEHFISIKVDREERPDLDQIYMTAVQLLTRQGGWPMSVWLTPDLEPFFGGTYFPPDERYGRPSFKRVLLALADYWANKRDEVHQSAKQVADHVRQAVGVPGESAEVDAAVLRNAGDMLRRSFDAHNGGFGAEPKFPHPMDIRLLLRAWRRFGNDEARDMATLTLDKMAMGGIYDHLGGGFARYSTDARWLVPHFEKMLYDNALLTAAYVEGFQASADPFYREVVEETLGYVAREMTSPEGPFYSTQDADSEGEEGRFFVWSVAQIQHVLGPEEAKLFSHVYNVTPEGNWEGHNILNRTRSFAQEAKALKMDEKTMRERLDASRQTLLAARSQRVWPGRDEKILTAWNGLMIQAFAQAAQVLDRSDYAETAAKAADFLLTRMRTKDGRLLRTTFAGAEPKLNGYLEDYAFLLDGLVSLYEATFAPRWLTAAGELAERMIEQFWDAQDGGFFTTGKDHETLIARAKDVQDGSTPSGNAMATTALLRLAKLTGRDDFRQKAETVLRRFGSLMKESPMAAGQMLLALDFHLGPVPEFAVVGDPTTEETRRVLRVIRSPFRPNRVVALKAPGASDAGLPLLAGKDAVDGKVTAYVCQNYTCQAPLVGVEAAEKGLMAV